VSTIRKSGYKDTPPPTFDLSLLAVNSGAPSTTFRAYKKAQEALQKLEDMTFTDAEIDAFLPKELKRDRPQI
jgi:hypothetical protein